MKKKGQMKIIKFDILPCEILFTVNTSVEETAKYVLKKWKHKMDAEEKKDLEIEEGSTTIGTCTQLKNKNVIMWVKEKTPGVVAHEALHATTFILNEIGVEFCDESDELWAYLIEHIIKKINS